MIFHRLCAFIIIFIFIKSCPIMWSAVVHSTINSDVVPKARSKHAVCLGITFADDQLQSNKPALFLLGGRMSNVALRDFWVMDLESGLWTLLSGNGKEKTNGKTPNVQEHSMIFWSNSLYVFGGTFTQNGECPLWIFEIQKNTWTQWQCPKGKDAPQCRKAHTAVTWKNNMLIYGGYQDFRGSLNELWIFSFDSNEWKMLSGNQPKRSGEILPPPRHSHSAVIYGNEMLIYGGMTDLVSRSDFWRYDLIGKRWEQIKMTKNAKINPGSLHGHAAVIFKSNKNDAMFIVGGEKPDGSLSDQVWSYHFVSEMWERLEINQPRPSARTQLTAVTLNTPFFTLKYDSKSSTAKRANVQNSSVITNTDNDDSMIKKISSFASNQGTLKTRPFLPTSFTLARNPGYHLVNRNENVDLSPPASRLPKSRYSLLSNDSNDSLAFEEINPEDNLPNMIRSEEKSFSHRTIKFRSESVHDFVSPATRCIVPRSLTTARFNPFDPTKVRRDETFDVTTSDYASEMDESHKSSMNGISNPVYDDFVTSNISGIISCENRDEEHINFALALNNSLETKRYRGERYMQLRKILFSDAQTDFGEQLKILGNPNVLSAIEDSIEDESKLPLPSQELCESVSLGKDWCILSIGGRESESKSNIFPSMPLSIWMLQIN